MDVNNNKSNNIPSSSGISGWVSSAYKWATGAGGEAKAKESEKNQEVVPQRQPNLVNRMDMPESRLDANTFFQQKTGIHIKENSIELEGNAAAYNNFVNTLNNRSANIVSLVNVKTIYIGNYNWDNNFKTNIYLLSNILRTVKDFECLKVGPQGSEKTITKADIQKIIDDSGLGKRSFEGFLTAIRAWNPSASIRGFSFEENSGTLSFKMPLATLPDGTKGLHHYFVFLLNSANVKLDGVNKLNIESCDIDSNALESLSKEEVQNLLSWMPNLKLLEMKHQLNKSISLSYNREDLEYVVQ